MTSKKPSKESHTTQAKNLKADSIIQMRELLKKLERMFHDVQGMSEGELGEIFPEFPGLSAADRRLKKTQKDFIISMIHAAEASQQTTQLFQKYDIDIHNPATQNMLQQQAADLTRGH